MHGLYDIDADRAKLANAVSAYAFTYYYATRRDDYIKDYT